MKKIIFDFYNHLHSGKTSQKSKRDKIEVHKHSLYLQSRDSAWVIKNSKNITDKTNRTD